MSLLTIIAIGAAIWLAAWIVLVAVLRASARGDAALHAADRPAPRHAAAPADVAATEPVAQEPPASDVETVPRRGDPPDTERPRWVREEQDAPFVERRSGTDRRGAPRPQSLDRRR